MPIKPKTARVEPGETSHTTQQRTSPQNGAQRSTSQQNTTQRTTTASQNTAQHQSTQQNNAQRSTAQQSTAERVETTPESRAARLPKAAKRQREPSVSSEEPEEPGLDWNDVVGPATDDTEKQPKQLGRPLSEKPTQQRTLPANAPVANATASALQIMADDNEPGTQQTVVAKVVATRKTATKDILEYYVPLSMTIGYLSERATYRIFRSLQPFLGVPMVSRKTFGHHINTFLTKASDYVKDHIRKTKYYALAFDGGLSKAFGYHCLVTLLITADRIVPLPVVYAEKGHTFDSRLLTDALVKHLQAYDIDITNIKALVADGAAVNAVAADVLADVASFVTLTKELLCEDTLPEDIKDVSVETHVRNWCPAPFREQSKFGAVRILPKPKWITSMRSSDGTRATHTPLPKGSPST